MKKKGDDIVAIRVSPTGVGTGVKIERVTLKERLMQGTDYALEVLEAAIEQRRTDLNYHGLDTDGVTKLETEWVDKPRDKGHVPGPKAVRRRQAVTALLLIDWLGWGWDAVIKHFHVKQLEQQSLENRVSELRKALHDAGVDVEIGARPPRGKLGTNSLH